MNSHSKQNNRKYWTVVGLFIVFATTLGFLLGKLFDAGYPGAIFGLLVSGIYAVLVIVLTETILIRLLQAKAISHDTNGHLYTRIKELSEAMRLPIPKLYYLDDSAMNILSLGRNPHRGCIIMSKGLIDKLTTSEVEASLAHELAHIKNGDTGIGGLAALMIAGFPLLSETLRRKSAFFLPLSFLFSLFSPLSGLGMQLVIPTKREFEADADSVLLTRYPQALIQALEKITHDPYSVKTALHGTAHLFITNPFHGKANRSSSLFFQTHPPIKDRIRTLQEM